MSRVEGRFTAFTGDIRLTDPIERSSVQATIEAASINTGNAERDAHLRSADFLDVAQFPVLAFRSVRVARQGEQWRVSGGLTIRDITHPAVLDVTYLGSGPDSLGGTRMALVATTQIARRDYEMNWNMGVPGGLVVVGPTLRIDLDIQAVLQPDGPIQSNNPT
jgi:polyisoprenoid-binding protein YceI